MGVVGPNGERIPPTYCSHEELLYAGTESSHGGDA
jgi:hypothetical protein